MAVERDTKDWTWVLNRPCEQCGFDANSVSTDDVAEKLRDSATRWSAVLSRDDVRMRPTEDQWSPLEYACHVLESDDPTFENWDQDETALEQRYCDQDPAVVRDELCASARRYADRIGDVEGDQWSRPGLRSNGSAFTVASLGRYSLHDIVHHLWDVGAPI
jgi:hypothetical protein